MAPLKFIDTACILCGDTKNFTVLYEKNIPPGSFSQKVFSARRTPDKIHYRMVQCKKDGQVRSHPIIKPALLYSLYRKSSFTYQSELPNLTTTYVKALLPTLKRLGKKARILEVGCGNGFVLAELFKQGYKNVYGIDPSTNAKKAANSKIRNKIKLGILSATSFKKESFDLICLFQTLDHIPNPAAFLKLCKTFLKPNGYLIAFNHDVASTSAIIMGERSPIIDIEHIYLFSKKTINDLFENQGYIVRNIYSPWNTLSISHLIHLAPLPAFIKSRLQSMRGLASRSLTLPLGNLCIIGQKPIKHL